MVHGYTHVCVRHEFVCAPQEGKVCACPALPREGWPWTAEFSLFPQPLSPPSHPSSPAPFPPPPSLPLLTSTGLVPSTLFSCSSQTGPLWVPGPPHPAPLHGLDPKTDGTDQGSWSHRSLRVLGHIPCPPWAVSSFVQCRSWRGSPPRSLLGLGLHEAGPGRGKALRQSVGGGRESPQSQGQRGAL